MKNVNWNRARCLLIVGLIPLSLAAQATSPAECKEKIGKARSSFVEMLGGKKDEAQQNFVASSANEVSVCIFSLSVSGKEAEIAELAKVWQEFKATREEQLVPAVLAGKTEEARAIGTGIQKERMDRINELIHLIRGGDL